MVVGKPGRRDTAGYLAARRPPHRRRWARRSRGQSSRCGTRSGTRRWSASTCRHSCRARSHTSARGSGGGRGRPRSQRPTRHSQGAQPTRQGNTHAPENLSPKVARDPILQKWTPRPMGPPAQEPPGAGVGVSLLLWALGESGPPAAFPFFGGGEGARHAPYGILVPRLGTKLAPLAVKVWSPNHWTAREFPAASP